MSIPKDFELDTIISQIDAFKLVNKICKIIP